MQRLEERARKSVEESKKHSVYKLAMTASVLNDAANIIDDVKNGRLVGGMWGKVVAGSGGGGFGGNLTSSSGGGVSSKAVGVNTDSSVGGGSFGGVNVGVGSVCEGGSSVVEKSGMVSRGCGGDVEVENYSKSCLAKDESSGDDTTKDDVEGSDDKKDDDENIKGSVNNFGSNLFVKSSLLNPEKTSNGPIKYTFRAQKRNEDEDDDDDEDDCEENDDDDKERKGHGWRDVLLNKGK